MITPFYLAIFLPAIFTQSPDLEFSKALAAVPVLNLALLIRTGMTGSLPVVQGGITIVTMVVWVAVAVAFAQWVMSREDVLLGTEGGLWSYLKRRRGAGRRDAQARPYSLRATFTVSTMAFVSSCSFPQP